MNRERRAVLVGITMPMMSFGFAAMSARDGSMENALRLRPQKLNISSSTSALVAVTRELEFDNMN